MITNTFAQTERRHLRYALVLLWHFLQDIVVFECKRFTVSISIVLRLRLNDVVYFKVCFDIVISIQVRNGTVHCCNKSQCNEPSLVGLTMPGLQCYTGSLTAQNTSGK